MDKKNREQRRREKFGHTGGATKDPWPQSEANPAFSHVDTASEAAEVADGGAPEGEEPTGDPEATKSGDASKA